MDAKKKAMIDNYKKTEIVGGVYCIECTVNHKKWIKSTKNIEGTRNRFDFAISINSCPEPDMRESWNKHGAASFTFTVLDTIEKTPDQTDSQYTEDLKALLEMRVNNEE